MAGPLTPDAAELQGLRSARATVDLGRLAANYSTLTAACPVPLMPVIKAEAYGHGAAAIARRLETLGVPMVAVAYVEEGVVLRAAGVRIPILVLAGVEAGQAAALVQHALTPVVATPQGMTVVLEAARRAGRRVTAHLKVDTGMSRLGFAWEQAEDVALRLTASGLVELDGFMTHLASADERADVTAEQLDRFDRALGALARSGFHPRWVHAANSAGLDQLRPSHTLARPGLLLYGLATRPHAPAVKVRPVMTVSARVLLVKDVPVGTAVSYGGRWVARRPSRIATLPMGYADGIPRTQAMPERGAFSIGGRRVPVAGTVCMDLVMLDVTDHPRVQEGDEVVVFGDDPTAWDLAEWGGTIVWEILTRVGARLPRVYVEDGRILEVGPSLFVR
jgi:alanine racemase